MLDYEYAIKNKQLLWLVYGPTPHLSIHAVKLYGGTRNPTIWGYSIWRNSPGFRTIGEYIDSIKTRYADAMLFDDREEALSFLVKHGELKHSIEDIRAAITPSLKFLKRESILHNLVLDV